MLTELLYCVQLLFITCLLHVVYDKIKGKLYNLPPSLASLPIVGSLPFLGQPDKLHELFISKSKQYGNVFSFNAGTRYTVVVNGLSAIRDCLLTRASEVAGRAEVYVERKAFNEGGRGIIFRDYDERLKRNRTHSLSILKQFGLGSRSRIESIIHDELTHVIQWIRDQGDVAWDPTRLLELSTMNIMHVLMFGARLQYTSDEAEYIRSTVRLMADSIDALFDFLPLCAYLPRWRRTIEDLKPVGRNMEKFLRDRINAYKGKRVARGNDVESTEGDSNFITEYLSQAGNDYEGSEDELNFILRDLLAGGTDTTSGQLGWALIMLANHPHVQQRAQDELDRVVGQCALPSLDHRAGLPYLEVVIMEVMRLRTAVPLGAPRKATTETNIGGYNVPKDTMILVNLWSAHMDSDVWDDPDMFRPERFLSDENQVINKDKLITFSLGKRSCPGELLARHEMFLFLAALIQRFHILPSAEGVKVCDKPHIVRVCTPSTCTIRLVERLSD